MLLMDLENYAISALSPSYLRSLYESIKDDLCSPQSVKYTADDVLVPKSFEEGLFK